MYDETNGIIIDDEINQEIFSDGFDEDDFDEDDFDEDDFDEDDFDEDNGDENQFVTLSEYGKQDSDNFIDQSLRRKFQAGHRQRKKFRFLNYGIESFNDVDILESLLFYTVVQKDTKYIAHILLERFGGLKEVLNADYEEMVEIPGIGENSASLIKLVQMISRRYLVEEYSDHHFEKLDDHQDCCDICERIFLGADRELLYVILLDRNLNFMTSKLIGQGSTGVVAASARDILQCAIRYNSSNVIIAHNHPDGTSKPSKDDMALTKKLFISCSSLGVYMHDHIVVGRDGAISMRAAAYCREVWNAY